MGLLELAHLSGATPEPAVRLAGLEAYRRIGAVLLEEALIEGQRLLQQRAPQGLGLRNLGQGLIRGRGEHLVHRVPGAGEVGLGRPGIDLGGGGVPARGPPLPQRNHQPRRDRDRKRGRHRDHCPVTDQVLLQHVPAAVGLGFDGPAGQIPLDIRGQRVDRRVAPLRGFRKCLQRNGVELVVEPPVVPRGLERRGFSDAAHHLRDRAVGRIRPPTGQQFIEDHAQRVHVRPGVDPVRAPGDLLGRGIGQCPEELAGLRRQAVRAGR